MDVKNNFGERLKTIRVSLGMSLRKLSKQIDVTAQTISNYELGKTMPPSNIVIALAQALNVKAERFFRPVTVKITGLDFRKKNSLLVKEQKSIMARIQDWLERYKEVEDLFPSQVDTYFPREKVVVSTNAQVEKVAQELRDAWSLGTAPIESMTALLEEHHIRVCFIQAPNSFDACTFWADDRPCIVARNDVPGDRLRFNLAHELGHLVIDTPNEGDKRSREKPAMNFASAFLVPARVFKRELGEKRKKISFQELYLLKHKYGLSMSAWMYRAKELNIITPSAAKSFFFVFRSKYGKTEPGTPYPVEAEPTRMKRLVLRAYSESMISETKAAQLLGLSVYKFSQETAIS